MGAPRWHNLIPCPQTNHHGKHPKNIRYEETCGRTYQLFGTSIKLLNQCRQHHCKETKRLCKLHKFYVDLLHKELKIKQISKAQLNDLQTHEQKTNIDDQSGNQEEKFHQTFTRFPTKILQYYDTINGNPSFGYFLLHIFFLL